MVVLKRSNHVCEVPMFIVPLHERTHLQFKPSPAFSPGAAEELHLVDPPAADEAPVLAKAR